MKLKYAVVYEPNGDGSYGAYVPDLPGCVAAGESIEEARTLIREAIELHLRGMRQDGTPIPKPATQTEYIDAA